ncbi:MAG TPA: 4-hydroxy-tetrahydrodipicolinate synthase [Elusimicrobiota bacterium]|jgi:4-hydroxy-tetrahydrodipicolinate synthase|nr:4-hydroxy-tetrahydrodipicolinate synthase [Elusimicrobiota bacterium]
MKLEGSFTALITPFSRGRMDEAAYRRLAKRQLAAGTAGLVPCGSTGEAATLTSFEKRRSVEICAEVAGRRAPVIAGIGTSSTWKTVEEARAAVEWGADALLVLAPYYNKPTQEGLYRHYCAVANAVTAPVVVYNIPGRTAVNVLPATLARIAKSCPNVVGVKEASNSLDQASEVLSVCPKGFALLSGDDSLTVPMMSLGAKGVISVVSNLLPKESARMCAAALKGDFQAAGALHLELFGLIKALFIETNPIPVKAAAKLLKLCSDEVRLPLVPASAETRRRLKAELARL